MIFVCFCFLFNRCHVVFNGKYEADSDFRKKYSVRCLRRKFDILKNQKNLRNFFETMEIMEMPFSAFIFYWQTIPGIFYHGNLVFFLALIAPSPWWFVIHFLSFFRCLHTQFGIFTSKPIWPLMQFIRFHSKKHLKCQCDLASPTDGHWRIQIELMMPSFRISESAFITIQQIE